MNVSFIAASVSDGIKKSIHTVIPVRDDFYFCFDVYEWLDCSLMLSLVSFSSVLTRWSPLHFLTYSFYGHFFLTTERIEVKEQKIIA